MASWGRLARMCGNVCQVLMRRIDRVCAPYCFYYDLACTTMRYMLLTVLLLLHKNYDEATRAVAALRSARRSSLGRGPASNHLVQELARRFAPVVAAQWLLQCIATECMTMVIDGGCAWSKGWCSCPPAAIRWR